MKKKDLVTLSIIAIIFLTLWFSGFLPKQVARIVADNYIEAQGNNVEYKLKDVDYSSAHNCYFAYYLDENNPNAKTRNIGVYYRWLPLWVYFDSELPK